MFGLGMGELVIILLIVLVVLGPSKLPQLAASLGKAMREFRKASLDLHDELNKDGQLAQPLRELREAVTLSADELKRQDELARGRVAALPSPAGNAPAEATATATTTPKSTS